MIEASAEPAQESWENINAINDVVREVFRMEKKLTVSVLQGSAGAGGAMMALASDQVGEFFSLSDYTVLMLEYIRV